VGALTSVASGRKSHVSSSCGPDPRLIAEEDDVDVNELARLGQRADKDAENHAGEQPS
jgi:hypothetical protein